jgi:predicted transcriptional regulator YdeE
MNSTLVSLSPDIICGPSIRTSFRTAMADIPAFWERIHSQKLLESVLLPSTPGTIIAAYSDYESDFRGAYTMTIGTPVSQSTGLNAFPCLAISSGNYRVFEAQGDFRLSVAQSWQYIWNAWPNRSERRYCVDFEVYAPLRLNQSPPLVDVCVGIQ